MLNCSPCKNNGLLVKSFILAIASLLTMVIAGCEKSGEHKVINLSKTTEITSAQEEPGREKIRIAVGGMITPREGFAYYRKLLDYIDEKLDKQISFVDREDYAEINELLKKGAIDVAFVCGGPYVDGHKDFGMELLVAPKAHGETVYYSYIIVPKDSDIKSFEDLRGKRFAFSDPLSNSGKLAPTYMLAKMNETPDSFFKRYDFTYAHDKSIKAVAEELVDAAAVDSLIWEYANLVDPEYTSRTRIIKKSPPYGIPPVVVRKGLAPEIKNKLREILLTIHEDPKGREILKGMMVERFVTIKDSSYDSIREMKQWLSDRKLSDNKQNKDVPGKS